MDMRRIAAVTALEHCELYVLTRQDLEEILDRCPPAPPPSHWQSAC
jgi:CRP-like cAMP-binding protein